MIISNKLKFIIVVLCLISNSILNAQYKSLDFEISTSPYFDDRTDNEYEYDIKSIFGISQIGLGYSSSIGKKMVISPKAAYGVGREWYRNSLLSSAPNVLPDSMIFEKKKKAQFLKLGIALSYWFKSPGKGPFAEAELQNIFSLSGVSEERTQIGIGAAVQEATVDYKDELKSSVPSLRIGVGYNLPINRISLFVRVSLEFRASTYFTTTDNYTWANRSFGFGFRYILQDDVIVL